MSHTIAGARIGRKRRSGRWLTPDILEHFVAGSSSLGPCRGDQRTRLGRNNRQVAQG